MNDKMAQKKKIIIDLDVVTVSIWDRKGKQVEDANKFIGRIKNHEFYVITPFFLLELVSKWKYSQLKDHIQEFYIKFTDKMLSNEDLDGGITGRGIDDRQILIELKDNGIKGEDSLLALVASIFDADCLVTFNRVHLRKNKDAINTILKKNGIRTIQIIGPEEA